LATLQLYAWGFGHINSYNPAAHLFLAAPNQNPKEQSPVFARSLFPNDFSAIPTDRLRVQQQLHWALVMAEALDVDALDTDLDEYVFLGVCKKLGYVIHPLDGQSPGTFLLEKNFAGTKSPRRGATHERAASDVLGSVGGRRCY